jgi:hypothetical protein
LPILPNRERHDRIVALVEEMLALHRRLAAARNGPRTDGTLPEGNRGDDDMAAQIDSIIDTVRRYIAELEKHHIPVSQAILYGS